MRILALVILWPLCSCAGGDWREQATNDAMQAIRHDLGDDALRFQSVQVVGDSSTGQVCGKLFGKTASTRSGAPARFIFYIDRTAGPWIEQQHGHQTVSDERFDFAWQYDCLNEGWRG